MLFRYFALLFRTVPTIAVDFALPPQGPRIHYQKKINLFFPWGNPFSSPGLVCLTTGGLELDDGHAIRHRLAHDTLPTQSQPCDIIRPSSLFAPLCTATALLASSIVCSLLSCGFLTPQACGVDINPQLQLPLHQPPGLRFLPWLGPSDFPFLYHRGDNTPTHI